MQAMRAEMEVWEDEGMSGEGRKVVSGAGLRLVRIPDPNKRWEPGLRRWKRGGWPMVVKDDQVVGRRGG